MQSSFSVKSVFWNNLVFHKCSFFICQLQNNLNILVPYPNTSHLLSVVQRIWWVLCLLIFHYFRCSLWGEIRINHFVLILCTLQVRRHVKWSADLVDGKLRRRVFIFVHLRGPANLLPPLPRCSLEHAGLSCRTQVSAQFSKQTHPPRFHFFTGR